jgi:type IV pilus assembly protein PilM
MDFSSIKDFFSSKGLSLSGISKSKSFVGIDVGLSSVKVVQLRKEDERAVLETYGQLKSGGYLKNADSSSGSSGFLRYLDDDIVGELRDVMRESNITSKSVVMSIPAHASFITLAELPRIPLAERANVLAFEARRYIPVPQSEVFTNWVVIEGEEETPKMKVLFVAVPKEVISKYQRIAALLQLDLRAIEVESFSIARSLMGADHAPTLIIHFGYETTAAIIVDEGIIRVNHTVDRGQDSMAAALATGLNINKERAEDLKNEIGLSQKLEQQEIIGILEPLVEVLMREIERVTIAYNRENERKIEKVILTGGGARMKGLVDYTAKIFGVEVSVGNAFRRTIYPQFMDPILRDLSPHFSVAVGLAMREISEQ